MFPRIEYVDWVVPRIQSATHDLGSSDLYPESSERGLVPDRLKDRDPAPESVEALVAAAYGVSTDQVLVTAGTTAANLVAAATALELAGTDETPGRVLAEIPGYEPHVATPQWLGATVDRFRRTREADWVLEPERIEAAATPDTALVTVSNRHNPTGVRTDRDGLEACAETARATGAYLLVDEVYAPYGEALSGPGTAFGGPTAAGIEGTVVTGSLTKFWGFGGLRIGWLVSDETFVGHARRLSVHLSDVARPSRVLARRALESSESLAEQCRHRCLGNHDLLRSFVGERPALSGVVPDGTSFALLEHDDVDDDELANAAWERDLLVVPGRFFDAPDGVRVSLGRTPTQCTAALDVFGEVLDGL